MPQLFTNYYVTQPVKETVTPEMIAKAQEDIEKAGIVFGKLFELTDIPYICYTSRIDEQVKPEEFFGRIRFGDKVHLYSELHYPFQTGLARLTLVKTAPERIGSITIGDNVFLPGTSIVSYQNVTIGNHVLLGPLVTIMDCDGHPLEWHDEDDDVERLDIRPVEIQDKAWIGMGSIILKGVTIGKNSVVGAHSVVTRSVPDDTVVAGNPARVIRKLGDK